VEPDEEQGPPDLSRLKAHLREHLANFKIPRHLHLVEELPKNATGKVLKRVLKERLLSDGAESGE
jgi:long-chain acyl-CoA synthetase